MCYWCPAYPPQNTEICFPILPVILSREFERVADSSRDYRPHLMKMNLLIFSTVQWDQVNHEELKLKTGLFPPQAKR